LDNATATLVPEVKPQSPHLHKNQPMNTFLIPRAATLSLILLDVDHFSAYNARYGHQAGDDCLRLIAVALKGVLRRPADLVARFAGEEFACLLPDTSPANARKLANDMAQRVRDLGNLQPGHTALRHITVSIGLVTRTHAAAGQVDGFLQDASAQLALAKACGPGQIRNMAIHGTSAATAA
jgi:diguanylate cyclase (GGDEF)-like protein